MPGDDVGDEHRAQRQQHVLDAVEGAAQDQHADAQGGDRDGDVAAGPRQDLHAGRDAGELGADRADVGDDERRQRDATVREP